MSRTLTFAFVCLVASPTLQSQQRKLEADVAKSVLLMRSESKAVLKFGKFCFTYRSLDRTGAILEEGTFETRENGRKIDVTTISQRELTHNVLREKKPQKKTFDGEFFYQSDRDNAKTVAISRKKNFRRCEGFFETIGWMPHVTLASEKALKNLDNDFTFVSTSFEDNICTIAVNRKLGGAHFERFDLTKGACIVAADRIGPTGELISHEERRLVESGAGFWIPADIMQTFYRAGTVIGYTQVSLDLTESRFNEVADVPDSAFVISVSPKTEVIDYRAGHPVISYFGGNGILDQLELEKEQRQLIERIQVP